SMTPSPSPTPYSTFGIIQTDCRDGTEDPWEECDQGTCNLECSDPHLRNPDLDCPAPSHTCVGLQACVYCHDVINIGGAGPPGCPGCPSGTVALNLFDRSCHDLNQAPGDDAQCTVTLGHTTLPGRCLGLIWNGQSFGTACESPCVPIEAL